MAVSLSEFAKVLLLVAFASPATLLADSVEYTLSGTWPQGGLYENFQYVASGFITSAGYADASSLNYCNANTNPDLVCWYIGFQPGGAPAGQNTDLITFNQVSQKWAVNYLSVLSSRQLIGFRNLLLPL